MYFEVLRIIDVKIDLTLRNCLPTKVLFSPIWTYSLYIVHTLCIPAVLSLSHLLSGIDMKMTEIG